MLIPALRRWRRMFLLRLRRNEKQLLASSS